MAKKVSWKWGGKTYSGTLIRETKTHKFARTKNGKIKKMQRDLLLSAKNHNKKKSTRTHLCADGDLARVVLTDSQQR